MLNLAWTEFKLTFLILLSYFSLTFISCPGSLKGERLFSPLLFSLLSPHSFNLPYMEEKVRVILILCFVLFEPKWTNWQEYDREYSFGTWTSKDKFSESGLKCLLWGGREQEEDTMVGRKGIWWVHDHCSLQWKKVMLAILPCLGHRPGSGWSKRAKIRIWI